MEYLLDNALAKPFILGRKAEFTLVSTKTNTRFTFRIGRCPEKESYTEVPPWFIFMIKKKSYVYIGTVKTNIEGKRFYVHSYHSPCFRLTEGVIAFKWLLKHLDRLPPTAQIYHIGKCGECGRKLTTPASIKCGIGPICKKQLISLYKEYNREY